MTKPPGDNTVLWRSVSADEIVYANWQGEWVVYHRPSGKTHLLNESSVRLIRDLLVQPTRASELVPAFLPATDPPPDAEIQRQFVALLERLEHLGLVRRESP